jgi:hypothetical protein
MHCAAANRFSLWVEDSRRGVVLRDSFLNRNEAIRSARKYWLTSSGLFHVFVRDADSDNAVVFDRLRGCGAASTVRETFSFERGLEQ